MCTGKLLGSSIADQTMARIQEERTRVEKYLHKSTGDELSATVCRRIRFVFVPYSSILKLEKVLIVHYKDTIENEFPAFLESDRREGSHSCSHRSLFEVVGRFGRCLSAFEEDSKRY